MNKNIILCGVGGQGTVLASKLISAAAMAKGMHVRSAETIGMAQRGGSVFSYIRIGGTGDCPMIARGTADMIIGFEPGEAVRMLPYLKKGGQVIVNTRFVMPVTAALSGSSYTGREMIDYLHKYVDKVLAVDTEKACAQLGSPKVVNLLLLGAAVATGALGLTEEDIKAAIVAKIPPKFHELNFQALALAKKLVDSAADASPKVD